MQSGVIWEVRIVILFLTLGLNSLMKIAIDSPETLSDNNLENIVDVWNRSTVVDNEYMYLHILFACIVCLYNLDSYCFKNWDFEISNGGQKVFKGAQCPTPKRNPACSAAGNLRL